MVVQASPDSLDETERLIPYVEDEVVERVDLETGEIIVNWAADY